MSDYICPYCHEDCGHEPECPEALIEAMNEDIERLEAENESLRTTLGAAPCKALMLQETPYSECFPLHNCEPCTCWRAQAVTE